MSDWIKIEKFSNECIKPSRKVLVYCDLGIEIASNTFENLCLFTSDRSLNDELYLPYVTHYMELPKPPLKSYKWKDIEIDMNEVCRISHNAYSNDVEIGFKNGEKLTLYFDTEDERDVELQKLLKCWTI